MSAQQGSRSLEHAALQAAVTLFVRPYLQLSSLTQFHTVSNHILSLKYHISNGAFPFLPILYGICIS